MNSIIGFVVIVYSDALFIFKVKVLLIRKDFVNVKLFLYKIHAIQKGFLSLFRIVLLCLLGLHALHIAIKFL